MTDSSQLDLIEWLDRNGGQPAQRATPQRRSKQADHAPVSIDQSKPEPQSGIDRDDNLIRFPVAVWGQGLWRSKVNKAAQTLQERKTEKGRANYWCRTIETLHRQMERYDATQTEISTQIDAFHNAVCEAMARQAYEGRGGIQ